MTVKLSGATLFKFQLGNKLFQVVATQLFGTRVRNAALHLCDGRRPNCRHQVYCLQFTVTVYGLRFTIPGRALELRLPVPAAVARELHCAAVAQTDTFSFSLSLSSAVCQSVFPSSCLFVCLSVRQSVSWLLAQSATPAAPQTAAAAGVAWRLVNFKLSVHTPGAHREAGTTLWGQIARRAATN